MNHVFLASMSEDEVLWAMLMEEDRQELLDYEEQDEREALEAEEGYHGDPAFGPGDFERMVSY